MLHIGSNLAVAGCQSEKVPPRIRRVNQTLFLMVVTQINFTVLIDFLAHQRRLAFLADKQSDVFSQSEK